MWFATVWAMFCSSDAGILLALCTSMSSASRRDEKTSRRGRDENRSGERNACRARPDHTATVARD
jgi:hypothetical protein